MRENITNLKKGVSLFAHHQIQKQNITFQGRKNLVIGVM